MRSDEPIPRGVADTTIEIDGRLLGLTNLEKLFWPKLRITKGDLLQYYARVAPALLPHLRDKAIVMKRYPNGVAGDFFFMKRAPAARPAWIRTCPIAHSSGNVIEFALANDRPSLLWLINLGCIDLNPWYSPCEAPEEPEYLHFDLDPCDAPFDAVLEAALIVRDALQSLGMAVYPKTSGGDGMHLYVGIKRGPLQHEVWALAKSISKELARAHPDILTAEYKVAKRPRGRVLLDYNQNRFGATLASIYSVRPTPEASVSTPVTWDEVQHGIEPAQFTMRNMPERIETIGDLWAALAKKAGRYDLKKLLHTAQK